MHRSVAAILCALAVASCGSLSEETGAGSSASGTPTTADVTATPSATPTLPPLPTKVPPCQLDHDTTSAKVTGTVLWNDAPLAGVAVEAFQPGAPGRGPTETTATTAADGSYQLTGLRTGISYAVAVMEQPGFLSKTGTGVEVCGQDRLTLAPITAYRTIQGLSLQRGATVAAGPQTLTWQPLAGADEYCVGISTPGDPSTYKLWTPQECGGTTELISGARVTATRYVSPALPAGSLYDLVIYARAKGVAIGVLPSRSVRFAAAPIGNVGPCAGTNLDAVEVQNIPYWFFQTLDQAAVAEVVTCLADDVPDRATLAQAFVATDGVTFEQLAPLPSLADGSRVWSATVKWKEIAAVGTWRSGETRWLVVRRQSDGRWAMEIVASAPH